MLKYPEKLGIFFFGTLFEKFFIYICKTKLKSWLEITLY